MFFRPRIGRSAVVGLAIGLGGASVAFAQTTPGPIPMFEPAQAIGPVSQSADFSVSAAEAYETNTVGGSNGVAPNAFRASGFYSELKADAGYARNGDHIKFGASGGSNIRYYPDHQEWLPVNRYILGAFTADLFRRTTVLVNESLAYSTSYLYGLFPGVTTPAPGPVSTVGAGYTTDETSASLSQRLTQHSTATFGTTYRWTDFKGALAASNVNYHEFSGHYVYRFSRSGTFRAGYTYREGEYWSGFRAKENGIVAGLDLARPLSRTRQATVQFSVGSTIIDAPAQPDITGATLQQQHGLDANVAASYDLGNTWRARGSFHRGVTFMQGFLTPLTINGYNAEVSGLVNRRLDFLASAGYSTGVPTIVVDGSNFNTRSVDARLRYALGRKWAAYAEYLYYFYRFDQQSILTSSIFGSSLDQSGLHFGLTLWAGVRRK